MKIILLTLMLLPMLCMAAPIDEARAFFYSVDHKLIAQNIQQGSVKSSDELTYDVKKDTDGVFKKVYGSIISALSVLWGFVNIPFWIFLMIASVAMNEGIEAENKMKILTKLKEIPRGFRTLMLGIVMAVTFIFFFTVIDKFGIFQYLFTIAWTMICLSTIGNKIARWVSEKYLHYDFGKKEQHE